MLDYDFNSTCIGRSQPKNMHTSLNMKPSWLTWIGTWKIILLFLLINLTDNAVKHTCIWTIVWRSKYKLYNSSTSFHQLFTFCSPAKEKEKQGRMKELTMAQWRNLDQNNRSVLARWYSVLWEKTGHILLPLDSLTAGREESMVDEIQMGFKVFKILNRCNYLGFYFVYYRWNITTIIIRTAF